MLQFRHDAARDAAHADLPGFATTVPALARSLVELVRVAPAPVPVLVLGETGTGKELIARAVHTLAARSGRFVAVNCGALPLTLVESELFGHQRGAFSGAIADRPGLIRSADRGTLFLDEIGDLPQVSQAALLRVLQEREVTPLGTDRAVPIAVKLVCATHHDLRAACDRGEFRADLYARLAGFIVRLPPLRDRRDDLGILIAAILRRLGPPAAGVRFTPAALQALLAYHWPHNIRELETALGIAVALSGGGLIELDHFPETLRDGPAPPTGESNEHRARLASLLREHRGNISAIARTMQRSRMQVHRWLKRYHLSPRDFR